MDYFLNDNNVIDRLVNETREQVSWLPERFAVQGKVLELQDEKGVWENGWVVKAAYNKLPEEIVIRNRDLHKHHRKATDV